jgi:hypothetical protein
VGQIISAGFVEGLKANFGDKCFVHEGGRGLGVLGSRKITPVKVFEAGSEKGGEEEVAAKSGVISDRHNSGFKAVNRGVGKGDTSGKKSGLIGDVNNKEYKRFLETFEKRDSSVKRDHSHNSNLFF